MDVTTPCTCPGTPHEGDTITLRDRLSFVSARAIRMEVGLLYSEGDSVPVGLMAAKLTEQYILYGIEAWSRVAEGKPIPVSRTNILEWLNASADAADLVADAADGLYSEAVVSPLAAKVSSSLPPTPTTASTSPMSASSEPTPAPPSKRSSTTTTPTDGIARISPSPAGDSSSSRNSASAA